MIAQLTNICDLSKRSYFYLQILSVAEIGCHICETSCERLTGITFMVRTREKQTQNDEQEAKLALYNESCQT